MILYAHDDFYFCPEWDLALTKEISRIGHKKFYLSGIMMNNGPLKIDCGDSLADFNEKKIIRKLSKCKSLRFSRIYMGTSSNT